MKTENHNTISSGAVWVLVIIVCLVASIGLLAKGQVQRERAYKVTLDSLNQVISADSIDCINTHQPTRIIADSLKDE